MLALQKTATGFGLELRETAPPPDPGPGEVRIAVAATAVCGTDLHIYEGTPGYEAMAARLPVTIGHELAGRVTARGPGAGGPPVGALVAVRPSVTCGRCAACLAGRDDDCTGREGIGVLRPGGFAAETLVPAENCVAVPADLDPVLAALAEPMTVSRQAVATGAVEAGQRVLVLGPGSIGQGIALFARAAGAAVTVAGRDDRVRLEALAAMGFDDLVDTAERPLDRRGYDVVIEATGVPALIPDALDRLRRGGILVICGIHPRPAEIDLTRLVRTATQIRGTYRAPVALWPEVVRFIAGHRDLVAKMVSHRLPLARALEGFELARRRQASKVVVLPT